MDTNRHTHTYLFHLGIPSLCIGSQWPAKTLQQHSNTHSHSLTPGSKPWTVNMFGPPSDRRLIQRECCKLCITHTLAHLVHFWISCLRTSSQKPEPWALGYAHATTHTHTELEGLSYVHAEPLLPVVPLVLLPLLWAFFRSADHQKSLTGH